MSLFWQGDEGPRGADGDKGERGDDVSDEAPDNVRNINLVIFNGLSNFLLCVCLFQGPPGPDGTRGDNVNRINIDLNGHVCVWQLPKYILTSLKSLVGTKRREGGARLPWKQRSERRSGKWRWRGMKSRSPVPLGLPDFSSPFLRNSWEMLFGTCIEWTATALTLMELTLIFSPFTPTDLTLFKTWLCLLYLSIVTVSKTFSPLFTFVLFLARGSQDPVESRGGRAQLALMETL